MRIPTRRLSILILLIAAVAAGTLGFRAWRDGRRPGRVVPYDGPPMPSAEPTAADPKAWAARWDDQVGLWWQHHAGHTPAVSKLAHVHPAPSAAARLLLAAQTKQLASVDVTAVLGALRRMQVLNNSSMHGCMRWYWEEAWPIDQNASFFTGLSLIALERCYGDQLDTAQRSALLAILTDLGTYCAHESAEKNFYYPNKCLGDFVCAWLIAEIVAGDTPVDADGKLRQAMMEGADYLTKQGWGWGEHLSDMYADVCLDELSLLLLLSRRLPEDVRARYRALFEELLALDDAFRGQPRVPALRSYAFAESPMHVSYRDWIRPLPQDGTLARHVAPPMPPELGDVFQQHPPLAATLYKLKWHELAPPRPTSPPKDLSIPCYDGIVATARVENDVRLGSVSRFPVMSVAEKPTSGMAWQCFPVSLWRPEGGWGYLQWESRGKDRVRAHPALDLMTGFSDQSLTTKQSALTVGQTYTIQRGGDVVALRVMPAIATEWDGLTDRFRLVAAPSDLVATHDEGSLSLRFPQRQINVRCIPISTGGAVTFDDATQTSGSRTIDWGPQYDRSALAKLRTVVVLWGVSINGPIDAAPVVRQITPAAADDRAAEERVLEVQWSWPNTQWRLKIDPRAPRPLEDLAPTVSNQ